MLVAHPAKRRRVTSSNVNKGHTPVHELSSPGTAAVLECAPFGTLLELSADDVKGSSVISSMIDRADDNPDDSDNDNPEPVVIPIPFYSSAVLRFLTHCDELNECTPVDVLAQLSNIAGYLGFDRVIQRITDLYCAHHLISDYGERYTTKSVPVVKGVENAAILGPNHVALLWSNGSPPSVWDMRLPPEDSMRPLFEGLDNRFVCSIVKVRGNLFAAVVAGPAGRLHKCMLMTFVFKEGCPCTLRQVTYKMCPNWRTMDVGFHGEFQISVSNRDKKPPIICTYAHLYNQSLFKKFELNNLGPDVDLTVEDGPTMLGCVWITESGQVSRVRYSYPGHVFDDFYFQVAGSITWADSTRKGDLLVKTNAAQLIVIPKLASVEDQCARAAQLAFQQLVIGAIKDGAPFASIHIPVS